MRLGTGAILFYAAGRVDVSQTGWGHKCCHLVWGRDLFDIRSWTSFLFARNAANIATLPCGRRGAGHFGALFCFTLLLCRDCVSSLAGGMALRRPASPALGALPPVDLICFELERRPGTAAEA